MMAEPHPLWTTLTCLTARAVEEGRIVAIEAPARSDRAALDAAAGRSVSRQDQCRACGSGMRTWRLARRDAYPCEPCQRAG